MLNKKFIATAFAFLFATPFENTNAKFIQDMTHDEKKSSHVVTKVESISDSNNGKNVFLKGYITDKLSKEKYEFKDSTGKIIVDLDEKYLPFNNFSSKDFIAIYGKVKKKKNKIEININRIELLHEDPKVSK